MAWRNIAKISDIAQGTVRGYEIGPHMIAIYNLGGKFYATSNICTHAFALLSEGALYNGEIECPLHQALFDVRSGEAIEGPADEDLQTFPVKVEGEDIFIDI